jgi:hypothetical protein
MFKESFTEYNEISGNTLSGPVAAFADSLSNTIENFDSSGNKYIYNSYTSYYNRDDKVVRGERRAPEIEKKSELTDNSLLFMGLGVAGLGAAVIVVMALRK